MQHIKGAKLLIEATKNLEASLHCTYEFHPENPETDFLNAAASVAFFSKVVFKGLLERQASDISASWALHAAIALGEYEAAARFLEAEIIDMKISDMDLKQLRERIEISVRNHGRSTRWNGLLSQIDDAM